MTRRRLLLHIGSPKCGSTYLQQVLRRNAELLLEHGFGYQHPGEGHPGNAGDLATITAERVETLYDFGVKTAILSHEDLYGLPKRGDALSSLVGPMQLDVQLVVFLRPFSEFVFGDYSQFMKQHFERYLAARNPYDGRSFEAVAQRRFDSLQPAQFLRNWAQRFPQHPIRIARHTEIRPTIESLLPGLPDLDWAVPRDITNPSLRIEDCDRIAAAMRDTASDPEDIREMFKQAFHLTDEPDFGRTAERVAFVEDGFAPQNAALLEQFGFDNRLMRSQPA